MPLDIQARFLAFAVAGSVLLERVDLIVMSVASYAQCVGSYDSARLPGAAEIADSYMTVVQALAGAIDSAAAGPEVFDYYDLPHLKALLAVETPDVLVPETMNVVRLSQDALRMPTSETLLVDEERDRPPSRVSAAALERSSMCLISHRYGICLRQSRPRRQLARLRDVLGAARLIGSESRRLFMSSEKGRGVGPGGNIQAEILEALATAPVLIVLLTPKSALSRWVWLEAGTRLGKPNAANPLLVCPSERFTSLLGPLSHSKALNLDNEGELVELVAAAGKILGRAPRDYLSYKPALDDLAALARQEYSSARERRSKVVSWIGRHAAAFVLAPLMLVSGWYYGRAPLENSIDQVAVQAAAGQNQELSALAARYLILNGTVNSKDGNTPISEALVFASRDQAVREESKCREPECTFRKTVTNGEFSIDLTRIKAEKEDQSR